MLDAHRLKPSSASKEQNPITYYRCKWKFDGRSIWSFSHGGTFNVLPSMWHRMEPAERRAGCPWVARLPIYNVPKNCCIDILWARKRTRCPQVHRHWADKGGCRQTWCIMIGWTAFSSHPRMLAEGKTNFKGMELFNHIAKRRNMHFGKHIGSRLAPELDDHLMTGCLTRLKWESNILVNDHCGEGAKHNCTHKKLTSIESVVK